MHGNVKHNKKRQNKICLFNISITLTINVWVGIHPITEVCLIFQRAFHTNVTKITNADTVNNTLKL